jgi:hypothetical protein
MHERSALLKISALCVVCISVKGELRRQVEELTVSGELVNYSAGLKAAFSTIAASSPLAHPPQETDQHPPTGK